MSSSSKQSGVWPWLAIGIAPLFFSTNLIFGRSLADELDPFLLAYIRWQLVALLLTPFVLQEWNAAKQLVNQNWPLLLFLGFLGMFVSGALVYLALHHTTAINSTLIYTTSPLFILGLEALFNGRKISKWEVVGVFFALFGVVTIVLKGDMAALGTLQFNSGDLLIGLAAISWAAYSILYRQSRLKTLSNLALFGIVSWAGAITLLPSVFFIGVISGHEMPNVNALPRILGLVFLSSIAAFGLFQYGVRTIGASISGLLMYLMPVYGVIMAITFLGETLDYFHALGIISISAGVLFATFPKSLWPSHPKLPSAGNVSNNQKDAL